MNERDPRIDFFDAAAADWEAHMRPIAETLARLDALAGRLPLRPGDALLELGCGIGGVTEWLLQRVQPGNVTAVDFSPEMLRRARQRDFDVHWVCHDICDAPPPGGPFDVVFAMHCFPHLRDQPAALRHIRDAIRPGGHLVVVHLNHWRRINQTHDRIGGPVAGDHLPPPGDWPALLQNAEFDLQTLADEDDLLLVVGRRNGPA